MGKVAEGGQYEVWADGVANSSTRLTRFHLRFPFVAWIGPKLKVKYKKPRLQKHAPNLYRLHLPGHTVKGLAVEPYTPVLI